MSQELIKKCYRDAIKITENKFFELKSEKLKKELIKNKLIRKNSKGYFLTKEGLKNVPSSMNYYNHVLGNLHEYYFATGLSNKIDNINAYQETINKSFLKYNNAPSEIKDKLNKKFEEALTQGIKYKKNSNSFEKVLLNGKGCIDKSIPSQSDVILITKDGQKEGISLKSYKNKDTGFLNTSPRTLIGDYKDLSYIKAYEKNFLDSLNLKNKSLAKKVYKYNKSFREECFTEKEDLFEKILLDIKDTLEKEDMHHVLLQTIKLNRNMTGTQVASDELKLFDNIYDEIINLKPNLELKTKTTLIIDNKLKLRLKYSAGNMVSSIKLQMDLI